MDETVRLGRQRVCAVCARVLDRITDENGENERWEHSYQDQPADHPAVPVAPDQILARYRCDFCNTDHATGGWVIPAKDFPMPTGGPLGVSDGDWGACERCGPLIVANEWGQLIDVISTEQAAQQDGMSQQVIAVHLARIYHRLRANMTGAPRRMADA